MSYNKREAKYLSRQLYLVCLISLLFFINIFSFSALGLEQSSHSINSYGTIINTDTFGWLHTDGRWIKDESGNIVRFVGVCESQSMYRGNWDQYCRSEADPVPMANRMESLGVSWVRICIDYAKWSDPVYGADYKALIDGFVHEFSSRKIYSTTGMMSHSFTTETEIPEWLNFLTELANRYQNNSGMVGIYIYNEPPYGALDWINWAVLGAQAVHEANPNLLILVHADRPNRNGIDDYWRNNPINVPNVVYVYHEYYWMEYYYGHEDFTESYVAGDYVLAKQQMEQSMYDRFFKYAVEYNMPIVLEEFGFNGGQNPAGIGYGNEPGWPQCQIDFMDLLEKYQIPWNEYSWWVKTDTNYGLVNFDYQTLSPVGEIWIQYLNP